MVPVVVTGPPVIGDVVATLVTVPPADVTVIAGVVVGLATVQPLAQETLETPFPLPPTRAEAGEAFIVTTAVPLAKADARTLTQRKPDGLIWNIPLAVVLVADATGGVP